MSPIAMLSQILPPDIVFSEQFGDPTGHLLKEEAALLGHNTAERRRLEFAAGRTCARNSLSYLGILNHPILFGRQREPVWPTGIVGSITHCDGYCAAANASVADYKSIGIDAEVNAPLPNGVLPLVTTKEERSWLQTATNCPEQYGRLIFSIKESIYKAWYPLMKCWLDFQQAAVILQPRTGQFWAEIIHPLASDLNGLLAVEGKFLVTPSHFFSCISLPTKIVPSIPRIRKS